MRRRQRLNNVAREFADGELSEAQARAKLKDLGLADLADNASLGVADILAEGAGRMCESAMRKFIEGLQRRAKERANQLAARQGA